MADNPEVQGVQPEQPEPVKFHPKPVDGPISHQNEEEDMMFGPTQRPEEHVTTGGYMAGQTVSTPPDGMSQWYAALRQGARDPQAPPRVQELWQLVNHLMNARDAAGAVPGASVGESTGNGRWGDMQPPVNFAPGERSLHGWRDAEHPTTAVPNADPAQLGSEDESPVQLLPSSPPDNTGGGNVPNRGTTEPAV